MTVLQKAVAPQVSAAHLRAGSSRSGRSHRPGYDYGAALGDLPECAEMVVIRPDHTRAVVATYVGGEWMP